jgi:hypothetical protein
MRLEIEDAEAHKTQRTYARLAGLLFLAGIVLAFGGGEILSRITGSGTFAEIAQRVAAGERLYRVALSIQLIATLSGALFFFALYVTLKPVSSLLAQLAMIFGLLDTPLGLLVRMCGFVRLQVYISAQRAGAETMPLQGLSDLMRSIATTTENIGGIPFGIGLLLFFCLFWKSRYIPRIVSGLGLLAFAIWIAAYLAGLVFPEDRGLFLSICYPPMTIALVLTGFWLTIFTIKKDQLAQGAVLPAR